ncbi:MAG: nitroreductase [Myxococcales bacterium]|nr:nitroreductase [Myxococcales bacterium]
MDTLAAMRARRTAHRWQPTPVDDAVVERCLEAAHQAPCHKHTWPWRFTLVGPRARARVTALAIELKTGGRPVHDKQRAFLVSQFGNPGALVVVSQVVAEDAERAREDYAACACAIENMMLAATAQGLHAKWSTGGLTRHPEVRTLLALPDGEEVVGFVWLGEALELPSVSRPPVAEVTRSVP